MHSSTNVFSPDKYRPVAPFDEMFIASDLVRPHYVPMASWLMQGGLLELIDGAVQEPPGIAGPKSDWDALPRIIPAGEWRAIARGVAQRCLTLNAFVADIYGPQHILRDGNLPRDLVLSSRFYHPGLRGVRPPLSTWIHVAALDLVRNEAGGFCVIEDNTRCPGALGRIVRNRRRSNACGLATRLPYDLESPEQLISTLRLTLASAMGRETLQDGTCVLLTPGQRPDAEAEHRALAEELGIMVVRPSDLIFKDRDVVLQRGASTVRVEGVYRRVDDDAFTTVLGPDREHSNFRPLVAAWAADRVSLCNAPGAGIADDKALYPYVPQMVRYYLGEDAILPNVESFDCNNPQVREHVIANLATLVVKTVHEANGSGVSIGPAMSRHECEVLAMRITACPRDFVAQKLVRFSSMPTIRSAGTGACVESRHVDLRPYGFITPTGVHVPPSALTRVAPTSESLNVSRGRGGASKDTWILRPPTTAVE